MFAQTFFLILTYLFVMRKKIDIIYAQKNIKYDILLRGSMSEPFSKKNLISDEYEYLNI